MSEKDPAIESPEVPPGFVNYRNSGKIIPTLKASEFDQFFLEAGSRVTEKEIRDAVQVEGQTARLVFKGKLNLHDIPSLTKLPDGFEVQGDLHISGCRNVLFKRLPRGMKVTGYFTMESTQIEEIPPDLVVGGNLYANACVALKKFHVDAHVGGSIFLRDCLKLSALPEAMGVHGDLDIQGCTGITTLPDDFYIRGSLNITDSGIEKNLEGLRKLHMSKRRDRKIGGAVDASPEALHILGTMTEINRTFISKHPVDLENTRALFDVDPNSVTDKHMVFAQVAVEVCTEFIQERTATINSSYGPQDAGKALKEITEMYNDRVVLLKRLVPPHLLQAVTRKLANSPDTAVQKFLETL